MKRLLTLGVLLAALVFAPMAQAKPVVLTFHAGGFLLGSPELVQPAVDHAERKGAKVVNVRYTLGDPNRALKEAASLAKRFPKRRTFAYGESAGGALVGRLAQKGLVKRAATYSPLADVTTFANGLFADAGRVKLIGRRSRAPILAMVAEQEDPAYARDIRKWARSDRKVKLREIPGQHLGDEASMRGAVRWLLR
jgi:acetyl esterase/lipase